MEATTKIRSKYSAFKDRYQSIYSKEEWDYIDENFFEMLHEKEIPDIIMQIYRDMGINKRGTVFYKKHLTELKRHFSLSQNIVDVGAGRIPAFANMIAEEQLKIGKGTVTVYDPHLVQLKPKYDNVTLHKDYFQSDTDVSNYDLMIGIMPCDVTETLLESAVMNYKEFYIAMCGCVHDYLASFYGFYGVTREMYQERVIHKAKVLLKEYGDRKLHVTKLRNTPFDYPILYYKKN